MSSRPRGAELFASVVEAIPSATLVLDGDAVGYANAAARALFGLEEGDRVPVGECLDGLLPDVADSGPVTATLHGVRRDGHHFPAVVVLAPVSFGDGRYTVATVRDQSAGDRDADLFRGLLEAAPDATVIVDASGAVVLANRQVENVLGYRSSDLIGQPVEVLVPERFRSGHPGHRARYTRQPGARPMGGGIELSALHRDGREIAVEISLSPLDTATGTLVSAAIRDVSERNRIRAESEKLREDIIATVSHELRTPLTSIIGYTELLGDLEGDEVGGLARELVERIERNAARELRLVDDLLTLSFLDDERLRMSRDPVELADVVRRVLDDHTGRAVDAGIEIAFEEHGAVCVGGDFLRLVQVVENLVTNAIKFTPAGGQITVRLDDDGDHAVLQVRDTGLGIPADDIPHLFDRLYRAPNAIAAHIPGAGLGLPIAKRIVDAHDGTLTVESAPGDGTTFTLRLPHDVDDPHRPVHTHHDRSRAQGPSRWR